MTCTASAFQSYFQPDFKWVERNDFVRIVRDTTKEVESLNRHFYKASKIRSSSSSHEDLCSKTSLRSGKRQIIRPRMCIAC